MNAVTGPWPQAPVPAWGRACATARLGGSKSVTSRCRLVAGGGGGPRWVSGLRRGEWGSKGSKPVARVSVASDATQLLDWEKLTLIPLGSGYFAIQTVDGHYLTATGGGGNIVDTIHSDATRIDVWETFRFYCRS